MSRKLRETWLIVALIVALGIGSILVARAVNIARHAHRADEPIRPWMSVPYIAHSHHVPQSALWTALGIEPHLHDRRPIGKIAREQKRPVSDLISELQSAVDRVPKPHRGPDSTKAPR